MNKVQPTTIFALASGRPPAAIAIVRVSGIRAHAAGKSFAGTLPRARHAAVRNLRNPGSGELLDRALVLRFDGPASATGEDVVEFHCHGGRAVVEALLAALAGCDDVREALPGEFTRRAFENGRIDLTEAEGLADLLEAETESQRRAALLMADGGLRRQLDHWQGVLLQLAARAEAAIDYDDDDVALDPALVEDCHALAAELGDWLERPRIEPLRDGVRIVIAGPPNSGKSSLLNVLSGTEHAIVSTVPGTTRDRIEVPLSIAGVPVVLTDTAGLRDSDDEVERIGIARARASVAQSDMLLWLGEPDDVPAHPRVTRVHSRCDLDWRRVAPMGSIAVSTLTGEGLTRVLGLLAHEARRLHPAEGAVALNTRQANAILQARVALVAAARSRDCVFLAEYLHAARGAFDRLTGRAGMEDVLDALFSRFCLGK